MIRGVNPRDSAGKGSRSELGLSPDQRLLSRLGITVTKKVDKRAVRRNRIKRIVREHYRVNQAYLLGTNDVVIIAMQGAQTLTGDQIRRELDYLFRKARLIISTKQDG